MLCLLYSHTHTHPLEFSYATINLELVCGSIQEDAMSHQDVVISIHEIRRHGLLWIELINTTIRGADGDLTRFNL